MREEETFGSNEYVYGIDCGASFINVYTYLQIH